MAKDDEAQALLPVTQADRDAAGQVDPANRVDYKLGRMDGSSTVQAFARHRISHSLPGDVGMREALRPLRDIKALSADIESKRVLNVHFNRDVTDADRAAILAAVNLSPRAALTPSPCPGDVGLWEALEKCAAGLEGLSAQNAADPLLQDWADGLAATARAALTPSALSDLQRLGQEYDDGSLGRFGHHPEPAIDFECEVEQIESIVADLEKGMRQGEPNPLERIGRAMTFRVGGDPSAVAAKVTLRELEKRAWALSGDAGEGGLREENKRLVSHIVRVVLERDRLRDAGRTVLDGLDRRIEASSLTEPCPVFEGIVELHDAITAASHQGAGEP